jgi:hypothetical protein
LVYLKNKICVSIAPITRHLHLFAIVLVSYTSHMQIKSNENNKEIQKNEELLTLDTISSILAKRLEENKLFPLLSLED